MNALSELVKNVAAFQCPVDLICFNITTLHQSVCFFFYVQLDQLYIQSD